MAVRAPLNPPELPSRSSTVQRLAALKAEMLSYDVDGSALFTPQEMVAILEVAAREIIAGDSGIIYGP